ncbi:MAG: pyruvate kinase [Gemmatimonadaceae bacterium]|nr:pyruvate kinase [Gemmatimonadaceae bacterium]
MSVIPPKTKIVGTLGPASATPEGIRALITAGLNVARINFSHGTHETHARTIALVREASEELGQPIAILGDLQGPRIRIGDLPATLDLVEGQELWLAPEGLEQPGDIPVTYDMLAHDVSPGNRILINDGLIELQVRQVAGKRVRAVVVYGGPLKSHKGMNLPGIPVSAPSITEKDRADIAFAVQQGLDYIALSFVRRPEDIWQLRALIPADLLVVAKIEKDVALDNMEAIVTAADAVMVARGDLGVELPFERVPIAQKRLIALCNRMGRPVITATQMLESMIEHPRPTRAEASDVANAILDGTDAVMLSAETAAGAYPVLAVEAMARIIRELEVRDRPSFKRTIDERRATDKKHEVAEAIASAVNAAVKMLHAPAIVCFTKSGSTARVVSSMRPDVPVLACTDLVRTWRQLALVWGVLPELTPRHETYEGLVEEGLAGIRRRNLADPGEHIVVTAGVPFDVPGTTNFMRIETV